VIALGRRRLAAALAIIACAAPAGAAQAAQSRDNIATATIEQDGGRAFDFEWSLDRQRAGVVDHKNIAQAGARCTDCRATAIAFQIVIVEGQPSQLAPVNRAVAVNDQCTRCVVYAGARQLVRVVDRPVRFTARGALTLLDIRRDLRRLEHQDLTADELAAALETQEARATKVLQEELVPRHGRDWDLLRKHDRGADDGDD
jgi:putative peptide zinc metalloprotease protein